MAQPNYGLSVTAPTLDGVGAVRQSGIVVGLGPLLPHDEVALRPAISDAIIAALGQAMAHQVLRLHGS